MYITLEIQLFGYDTKNMCLLIINKVMYDFR